MSQWDQGGPAFEPVCEESALCMAASLQKGLPQKYCRCSGEPSNLEVIDFLKIPAGLKPGKCESRHRRCSLFPVFCRPNPPDFFTFVHR